MPHWWQWIWIQERFFLTWQRAGSGWTTSPLNSSCDRTRNSIMENRWLLRMWYLLLREGGMASRQETRWSLPKKWRLWTTTRSAWCWRLPMWTGWIPFPSRCFLYCHKKPWMTTRKKVTRSERVLIWSKSLSARITFLWQDLRSTWMALFPLKTWLCGISQRHPRVWSPFRQEKSICVRTRIPLSWIPLKRIQTWL